MSTVSTLASRSWGGCARCRKRRQKCDEQKPSCQRCLAATAQCEYQAPLKWGGRAFGHSRFGKILGASKVGGLKRLKLDDGAFLYTVSKEQRTLEPVARSFIERLSAAKTFDARVIAEQKGKESKESLDEQHERQREVELEVDSEDSRVTIYVPDQVPQLPASTALERQLLHHFIHHASRATSCHYVVQQDMCRTILPMAMESPALLSATLVLSAIHQKTMNTPVQPLAADHTIAGLKTASLRHLRNILSQPRRQQVNVMLATVRTLCLAEVYDDGRETKSWRAHFDGARALIRAYKISKKGYIDHDDASTDFLHKWFSVTEGLIALTPESIPARIADEGYTENQPTIGLMLTIDNTSDGADIFMPSKIYLDEYTGCSTDLPGLFGDLGLAIKMHQHRHGLAEDGRCTEYSCSVTAARLEHRVRNMITRDQIGKVVFHPKTASQLSRRQVLEFALCNRAYQYSALLQIQRRLFNLPATHCEVQAVVNVIIGCVEGVYPTEGLSPLAVLTTPVFAAGCEAFGHDRARVRRILDTMYNFLRIPNMRRALDMLDKYWPNALSLSWAEFAKLHGYDFLPY